MKKLTVEGIRESAKKIHYGAGHDAILFLLSELDRERAEVNKLRGALSGAATAANIAGEELKKIREERERLIEGLRKIRNYYREEGYYGYSFATETLKSIGIDV